VERRSVRRKCILAARLGRMDDASSRDRKRGEAEFLSRIMLSSQINSP
jgi:hypothetical protein